MSWFVNIFKQSLKCYMMEKHYVNFITKCLVNNFWASMLTSLSGVNHIHNEHEDLDRHGSYSIPSKITACYSYYIPQVYMSTSYSGTNHFLDEHDDLGQYHPYAKPSDKTLGCSYTACLVNRQSMPIELHVSNLIWLSYYVSNGYKNFGQYQPHVIPFEILLYYTYPASVVYLLNR